MFSSWHRPHPICAEATRARRGNASQSSAWGGSCQEDGPSSPESGVETKDVQSDCRDRVCQLCELVLSATFSLGKFAGQQRTLSLPLSPSEVHTIYLHVKHRLFYLYVYFICISILIFSMLSWYRYQCVAPAVARSVLVSIVDHMDN